MSNFIIGINGGSASGKTIIANQISERLKDNVAILRLDDYYKDQSEKTIQERRKTNYDHPDAFDFELFIEHLKSLKAGETINKPVYDYSVSSRKGYEKFEPKKIIIIEGFLIFSNELIRELLKYKIFVDAPADVRFIRRLKRDINERNRTIESVSDQYLSSVKLMHEIYVEPTKIYADIIVNNIEHFDGAVEMIIASIEKICQQGD